MSLYPENKDKVGMAINYYWRPGFSLSVRYSTLLSIQMLKENAGVGKLILVDGSPVPDDEMSNLCCQLDVRYYHHGGELGFAAGFNVGWRLLDEPYVGLMVNDIFPPKDTISCLIEYIKLPDVGCVYPYLSYCDYPGQMYGFVNKPVTCEPTTMTLNLNIFKREVLERVGGVDEAYSGSYNDLILLMKIRELGYRVLLVGKTRVFHLGQITISQGTTYKKEKDRARFVEQYGAYSATHGMWQVRHWEWPLATTRIAGYLWWISQKSMSTRVRNFLQALVMRWEPELTKFPAKFGKSFFIK